jgi:putative endonuclease
MTETTRWWLYLLECEGGSYYAGIALDVEERFYRHVFGRGARYTRSHPPLKVIAARRYASRSEALKAEYALKQLARADKPGFFRPMRR